MTDPGFLSRWSRRKAIAARPATLPEPPPELPPLDTLGPTSDYAAFLEAGVSAATQVQALRIAWETDPTIANFRGMAEYDWDFNAPGYAKLAPTDDVAALLKHIITPLLRDPTPPPPEPNPVRIPEPPTLAIPTPPTPTPDPQIAADDPPHHHGSAMPTLDTPITTAPRATVILGPDPRIHAVQPAPPPNADTHHPIPTTTT